MPILDRFGIDYFAEEKQLNPDCQSIIDQNTAEIDTDAEDLIYEDDNFRYYMPEGKCKNILVYYTDGTSQNIYDALESGRISMKDLDQYEIAYRREEKYVTVMQRDGKEEAVLQDDARETVEQIMKKKQWLQTVPNRAADLIVYMGMDKIGYLDYHTACGTFTDHRNMICCTVTEEERLQLLELFSSVIPIP